MDCSLPGFSVHGILQARRLECVAISFSRASSQPRDWTWVSCIAGRFCTIWALTMYQTLCQGLCVDYSMYLHSHGIKWTFLWFLSYWWENRGLVFKDTCFYKVKSWPIQHKMNTCQKFYLNPLNNERTSKMSQLGQSRLQSPEHTPGSMEWGNRCELVNMLRGQ